MAHKIYIGIDNGVSGSIGTISDDGTYRYYPTPITTGQNYTKAKQNISRIDYDELQKIFQSFLPECVFVALERPMVNPTRFKATVSAVRALEATLIAIEQRCFPYMYIDSKEWQKALLPSGLEGPDLKKASLDIGQRLFPNVDWTKLKDADGLLIAEYARRKGF